MSAATRTAPAAAADEPGSGPVPRRVRPPRWLDLRLVLGVLLVLGSVLLGARVLTAADATVPVWSVAGDLAAGTVLEAGDLVPVDVRLGDAAGAYLSTGTDPAGRTLARALRAGELLPRTALEEPRELVQVALPVQAGYVPPGLGRGQVVDVYGVTDPAGTATGEGVVLVVGAVPVQAVSGRAEGVLSTATTTVQVVVSVPAAEVPGVLGAIGGRPLVVVVHGSVDADADADADPDGTPSPARPSAAPVTGTATAPAPAPAAEPTPVPSAPAGPVPVPDPGAAPAPATPAEPTA
ncbi:Chaperone for flagella basal body P-ring formation [Geodermatophilus dictyosporus]|uniref:Chaperone for flagella basal body P-ring formation n=1 Tax=Geodermatophilus dictyosporus TaxID=1523247 RepID=A0A1I5L7K2_9ACTN|nr:SAF domain-containing protein [Geodermatophilus dictyosporus]SFO93237.1 Chaperone for flagella basal body P-ring formation [Geodermatophilus dictyosporus]